MSSISDLARFRVDGKPVPATVEQPAVKRRIGSILAFDQAVAATGWACLVATEDEVTIRGLGTFKTVPITGGHEDTLLRAVQLHADFERLIDGLGPDIVAHETPPVGARMSRPESSLVAATALRIAAAHAHIDVVMIGAQRAKKRLTGNGNATKPQVREALLSLLPSLSGHRLNENVVDATAIGMTAIMYPDN